MKIEALVLAAGDEQHVWFAGPGRWHGEQGLVDGVQVGRLRVVDESDAVDFRHQFTPVRRRFGGQKRLRHFLQGNSQHVPNRQRSHQILGVVRPAQPALVHVEQRTGPAGQPADQQAAVEVEVRAPVVSAEGDDLGGNLDHERAH